MASVFIEERAFNEPDLKVASLKHKVGQHQIMGAILYVWRHSQQKGERFVTKDELLGWLSIDRYSKASKLLTILIDADFVRATEKENVYEISGNERAIVRTHQRIAKSKKAANTRYQKEKAKIETCLEHAQPSPEIPQQSRNKSHPRADVKHAIQTTDNRQQTTGDKISLLRNDTGGASAPGDVGGPYPWLDVAVSSCEASSVPLEVSNTIPPANQTQRQTRKTSKATKDLTATNGTTPDRVSDAIAFYCDAYRRKFKNLPAISGVESGTAKRLVKEFGLDRFKVLVEAYLCMDDYWFIKKGYTIKVLAEHLNNVKTFAETGVQITGIMAKSAERDAHNDAVFERALARAERMDNDTAVG